VGRGRVSSAVGTRTTRTRRASRGERVDALHSSAIARASAPFESPVGQSQREAVRRRRLPRAAAAATAAPLFSPRPRERVSPVGCGRVDVWRARKSDNESGEEREGEEEGKRSLFWSRPPISLFGVALALAVALGAFAATKARQMINLDRLNDIQPSFLSAQVYPAQV